MKEIQPREVFPIKKSEELVILKGIIIPVDWDTRGNAIALAISTHGEEEYLIYDDNKGRKLFNFIKDSVRVKGKIEEVKGIKLIKIDEIEKCILEIPKLT